MAPKWQWIGAAAVFVGGATVLSSGYRVQNFSCAKCRNHKRVESRWVLGCELAPKISIDRRFATDIEHLHAWWPYASYQHRGVWGILGKQVSCAPHEYEDGRGPESIAKVAAP